jgi:SdrD B-like domain
MSKFQALFLILVGLVLGCSLPVQAQSGSSITMTVYRDANTSGGRDAGDGVVPGAKVSLQRVPGNEEVAEAIADEEGNVTFNDVPPGEYIMVITYAGGISITTNQFVVEPNGAAYAFAIPVLDATTIPTFAVLQVVNPANTRGPGISPFAP